MLLRNQIISYFNVTVEHTIWLKSYLSDIQRPHVRILREVSFSQCLFLAAAVLTALCGCCSGNRSAR